jgi:hypothetical protein
MLLTMLADGRLHLTAIVMLAPHLTRENRDGLLERAAHLSKRQIAEIIAEIAPQADVPAVMRKLPERGMASTAGLLGAPSRGEDPMLDLGPDPTLEHRPDGVAAPEPGARRDGAAVSQNASQCGSPSQTTAVACDASTVAAFSGASASPVPPPTIASVSSPAAVAFRVSATVVQPLSPGRYKVQFTASAEFREKLEKLRALMGARGPDGDLAAVIEQAVTEKLERLEARRFRRTKAARKGPAETETQPDLSQTSRHIPATVRRDVSERDGGRCRYVDGQGRRCAERNHLEFHHRHPFGFGGDHSVANVRLMCRAHNAYLADCDYGRKAMAAHRRVGSRASPVTTGSAG